VVKNKVAPPFRQAEFEILYNQGICHMGEIVDLGVTLGLIDKAGAWYSYQGERIGQGKDNVKQFLKDRTEICQKLEMEIRKNLLNKPSENSQPEVPELETENIE
jgi:recombination protein RecA